MEIKNNHFNDKFNFSKVGNFSMNQYSYLIDKTKKINEQFLNKKNRRKLFNDYFQEEHINTPKSDDIDSFFSNDDIFSKSKSNYSHSKERNHPKEFQIKSSCSYLNKVKNKENEIFKIRKKLINNDFNKTFDKYKYHLLHHNETPNDFFDKKKISPSCTRYNPKLDYIYKKLIYSLPFKKISGRQEKSLINKRTKNLNYSEIKVNKNAASETPNKDIAKNQTNYIDHNIHGAIYMKYQLSRQSLPNYNDFRIRIENSNDLSLDKKHKYQFNFRNSKPLGNNKTNLANYKKLASSTQSSLNSFTNRTSKLLLNNNKHKKIIDKIEKIINNNNSNYEEKILKNEKIKYEIKKKRLNKKSFNKVNRNIDDNKNNQKINPKEKDNSKILFEYIDYLNQKKLNNHNSLYKSPNNQNNNKNINKKNSKSFLYSSKSCLNLNMNKTKNSLNKKYKGINFEKMLSRTYLNKINKYIEPIHPMITPNYSAVEPKSIMKVLYSKKENTKNPEKFYGFNDEFTYDINKIFNNYNNHISPKTFYFNKMGGRGKDNKNSNLPFFMERLFDRNSIDYLNENSLKMNNYINGNFKEAKSTFNDKKSFNIRLKLDEIKKKGYENIMMEYKSKNNKNNIIKKFINKRIENKDKKIKKNIMNDKENNQLFNKTLKIKSWKNLLGEFYRINYDELEKYHSFIGTNVDAITLKSFSTKDKYQKLLSKKEKEIFELDFNKDI